METQPEKPNTVAAVLPCLNPPEAFERVVAGLLDAGFCDVVIVDDGSRAEFRARFARAGAEPRCHVLRHEVNRGKGAALKTAFAWLSENRPDCTGAVTVDGDGQHLMKDVLACAAALMEGGGALILGCRDFNAENVPPKSRVGNRFTRAVLGLLCGVKVSDTQTGLRGVPAAQFQRMLTIRGERYEYETNMLLELRRDRVPFREVPIETVYDGGNAGTHFRPIADSLRIYRFILLYVLSSLAGALLDLAVFHVLMLLLTEPEYNTAVLISTYGARVCSAFLNFNLNRSLVFNGKGGYGKTLLRYALLAVCQAFVSAQLVAWLSALAVGGAGILTTLIKFGVDTLLFFLSFRIQQNWVFRK